MLETMISPQIVFEDDDVLVLDKPANMVCHSAQRPEQLSLAEWLREHGVQTPRMINRLDRETSGLITVAKNERAAKALGKAVLRRQIQKEYLAICHGSFEQNEGVVDQPIAVSPTAEVYTKRVVDCANGKRSVTRFEVVASLGKSDGCETFTLVKLMPETGRAHQLRVHMAWLGHAIVGDKIYGPDERLYLRFIECGVTEEMLAQLLMPRHALHAGRLWLQHPTSGQECEFQAPIPSDMQAFIEEHR